MNVIETILALRKPSYTTTSGMEIRVRCPYCGDSKKDLSQAHMYIQTQSPYKFFCQKCTTSGTLNNNVLKDLGIYDGEVAVQILEENKVARKASTVGHVSFKKKTLLFPKIDSEQTPASRYFNSRFRTSYTASEISDNFKAIVDAKSFFELNKIYDPRGYDFQNAIGFLSADNSHIIFRDITGKQYKRYHNLALNDNPMSSKIYNIPTTIDLLSESITLVMAEGIFDIISIYENFYKGVGNNYIFAAACGKSYESVIEKYIGLGFLNIKPIIYSDADVSATFYRNMKSKSIYLDSTIMTVYYNEYKDEKDFGVPKERISPRAIKIR